MLAKITGLAGALGVILAIVAALITIPNLDIAVVLVVLGLIAGIGVAAERILGLMVAVLAYPALGAALALLPMVGEKLNAITGNLALGAAGAATSAIAIYLYGKVMHQLTGLAK